MLHISIYKSLKWQAYLNTIYVGELVVSNHCNLSLQIDWNQFNLNFKSC